MLPPVPTPQTFTYDVGLTTWLDYARWRLDDVDEAQPYLWNETYISLLTQFGPSEGLALAASAIAVIISKQVTAFGEAAGIRFSKRNLDYFQQLPDIIRTEPAWGLVRSRLIKVGKLPTPQLNSASTAQIYNTALIWPTPFKVRVPDTLPVWEN